jgi:hypothetical protein
MSGDHDMYLYEDDGNYTVDVSFRITSHGVTTHISFEKSDECSWQEVLDPIIRTLEGHWGYAFDLSRTDFEGRTVGMWYPGKDDAE